jgi:hypothetical protein
MERITYRITLDTHRNGIQRTLQGFETADKVSRRIAINLTAGGDTYELPMDHIVAVMYVTTPNAKEPSINECTIDDHTVIYDALPIVEEGVVEMQLKLIDTDINGAKRVIASPRFSVEVTESGTNDDGAEQTTTFTALENAIAVAHEAYNSRIVRVEVDPDCTFRVNYADGTVYESDALYEAVFNGNTLLSESWAKGGTGVRAGEDTDNSMYYSNVSRSASEEVGNVAEEAMELLDEAKKHSLYTAFQVSFESGNLAYISTAYDFNVNEENGDLEVLSGEDYNPEGAIGDAVDRFVEQKSAELTDTVEEALSIAKGRNKAHVFDTTEDMNTWLSNADNKCVCGVGDNLYIVALDVPDWWVAEVLEEAEADTGFYYKIAQLETQKADLTEITNGIEENADAITALGNSFEDAMKVVPKSTTVKKIELVTALPESGVEGTLYFTYEEA